MLPTCWTLQSFCELRSGLGRHERHNRQVFFFFFPAKAEGFRYTQVTAVDEVRHDFVEVFASCVCCSGGWLVEPAPSSTPTPAGVLDESPKHFPLSSTPG